MQRNRQAFTLAEMMVVMLILTVILAAFAPMMTKRKTVDLGTPWRWAANNRDIYFGLAPNQSVMIGRNAKPDDDNAKLIIQTKGDQLQSHILFKDQAGNSRGRIILNNGNFLFGNDFAAANSFASSTAFGNGALSNNTGDGNTAIGNNALNRNSSGIENTAVGHDTLLNNTTGQYNLAIGFNALRNNTTKHNNVAIGWNALGGDSMNRPQLIESFDGNLAIGTGALSNSGDQAASNKCVAIGTYALSDNPSCLNNIAIGMDSMARSSNTAQDSVAIGEGALRNAEKSFNVAIGVNALLNNHLAVQNTAVGFNALNGVTPFNKDVHCTISGACTAGLPVVQIENTAVGYNALRNNFVGNFNTAIGSQSLTNNQAGRGNVAIGYKTLTLNTGANNNTAIGNQALASSTSGSGNTAIGAMALTSSKSGTYNTAVGYNALKSNESSKYNTAIGYAALESTTEEMNTAVGYHALFSNTTGKGNTAVGYNALSNNVQGSDNIAIGQSALASNTKSYGNLAIGVNALKNFSLDGQTGGNIAIGANALKGADSGSSGTSNLAIGQTAMFNNTIGAFNLALGNAALYKNTEGNYNTALGYNSLYMNTAGDYLTAVGFNACSDIGNAEKVTCIGYNSGPKGFGNISSPQIKNTMHIGTEEDAIFIARRYATDSEGNNGKGGNVYIGGNDSVVHVGSGTDSKINIGNRDGKHYIYVAGDPSASSGKVGGAISIGGSGAKVVIAGRIVACNGNIDFAGVSCSNSTPVTPPQNPAVTYTTETQLAYTLSDMRKKNIKSEYKSGLEQIRQMMPKNFVYKDDEHKINRVGLIAQDLEKIMPEAVKKDKDGFLRVSNEHIKYALVNAVKQLDTLVQNIVTQVKELADKILCIDKRVKELEKENKELKQQIDKINKRLEKLENDD